MQRTESPRSKTPATPPPAPPTLPPSTNGQELSALLGAMQAVKNGDFSVRLPGDWTGLHGKIADTFNEIVTANASMARELERVGTTVGKQGKTRQRVRFGSPAGAWAGMEASVNTLIDDLLRPTTEVTRALEAVAKGDLLQTVRLDVEGRPLEGEFLRSATIVNTMIEQLGVFTSEVTRVAREVGTDGKLGGQAEVRNVSGVWKDLTDSVNSMASNLTGQVRNISEVTIAVASGDLSRKITVDVRGEILQLKEAINTMVDQLRSFASEVTRVAQEVGTEGRLGGQAVVPGVAGTWKDLTDSVNAMARNLTDQVRNIAEVTTAVARGDLSRKITVDVRGEILELKNTINTMVDQLNAFASEVTRVAREVGTDGKLGGQAQVPGVTGTWKDLSDNVNFMASNLTAQVRNIAEVATAIAGGDLSKKITVNVSGEILLLKETINTMVDQLNAFAGEVTRVAREVGTEGRLGGQAKVLGVAGTWKDLTDSVNWMANNLTAQVRNIAEVATAIASGDLTKKITVDVSGEILQLKETMNTMVDQLNAFAGEATRVAREVGTEGKLGGQAQVPGVAGTWKDLTDNVNLLAANLTTQVRNIAEVTTAVARGDLSRKITVDAKGEILELKNTINTMVDQLNGFAAEVTRVAREVGTEGKLGGQAQVPGVDGTWKDLTDNVNLLAGNLTVQLRDVSKVATAIANGDLSQKITVDVSGEILQIKDTINTMVDQLNAFAGEVTRVAREVGTDGRLGGQANVRGVAGTWKDLTDSVNSMANNLTAQVRNIADVATAIAKGDLSRKITVDVKGEILELKNTINTMVDQLNAFAAEVTRVAREVGTEGRLGGQAQVQGVAGTWKDLTDSVNFMASNLTAQVRNIAEVATAIAGGDLSKKITVDVRGEILLLKETLNTMVEQLRSFAAEVTRVAREVGTDGRLGGQAVVPGVGGTWKDLTDNVNLLAANLTTQVRNIAEVTTAVARGDLSRKITVDVKGEILELKNTINTMVDQLNGFAAEVTRVAREVGTEGLLGGQAVVPGVGGTWKDLTDNVNVMAANLTEQVRGIVKVVTAVANGDLEQNLTVKAKGEVAALADTINNMTGTLATFADQVTSVAREVGVEGRLGGQANVPGAAGTWKDLTGNVNLLAANLTTQVRAIAEVATAVTKGDLTRSIQVDALGEVAELKDNLNTMIDNLRLTTDRNTEQDWLKTNLARFTGMLQGQRDLATVGKLLLTELVPLVNAHQGVIYQKAADHARRARDAGQLRRRRRARLSAADAVRRRLRRPGGARQEAHADHRRAAEHRAGRPRLLHRAAAQHRRLPGDLRRPDQGGARPGLAERVLGHAPRLPRAADRQHRHRAELDRGDDADGRPAQAVAAARRRAAGAAGRAAADQRAAGPEGAAAGRAERRGRAQEPGDRAGAARARGEGRGAGADLEVQVRVPRQHVARAAHAAEQHPDPRPAALRQPRAEPHRQAGRVRAHHPRRRHRPPQPDHGHPGPLEDRVGHGDGRGRGGVLHQPARSRRAHVQARRREPRPVVRRARRGGPRRGDGHRLEAPAADPQEPALERLQVHRPGRRAAERLGSEPRLDAGASAPQPGGARRRLRGVGHRHRHPAREAAHHLRGLPAGRRQHQPQVRRHRSRPRHQPRAGQPARRRDSAAQQPRHRQQLHALPAAALRRADRPRAARAGAADRRTAPAFRLPVRGPERTIEAVPDDREHVQPGEPTLLVVEDDPHYARVLVDLAHDHGLKVLAASRGADALALARQYRPTAVSLDVFLPDMLGWTVLSQLKQDPETRHIPVQMVTLDEDRQHGLARGAFAFLTKPGSTEELNDAIRRLTTYASAGRKRLLVVEDNPAEQLSISELLGHDDLDIVTADTGAAALAAMAEQPVDCVVLDLRLPDMSGFEVLETISRDEDLATVPVVVFTGRELSPEEDARLRTLARSVVVKGVESPERLLDETSLFLHRVTSRLPREKQNMLERLHRSDDDLVGKAVLVVDDDVRNIFALSSVLERRGMKVLTASTGSEAIELLERTDDLSIVLMDIMMPEMDGYQTMRRIRENPALQRLPIVALTAKAMKGDREKCFEAGASDYLAKPVNTDQLLSALRMWLHR